MKRWLVVLAVSACSSTHGTGTGSGSVGSGGTTAPPVANAKTCDDVKPRVEQMYRGEAQIKEPKRVDDAVADNTAMVMSDCEKAPDRVAACVVGATTVTDLEARCLAPIDDEGTEGDKLVR